MSEITLADVRLRFTEDVLERKLEVLRAARLDVKAQKSEAQVGVVAAAISKDIAKLTKRKKVPLHHVALALEYVSANLCSAIYDAGAQASVEGE